MKKQFTLSELVLVTVICAVSTALIIPAVNAKEGALQASCTGNLKQMYAIEQMYANDNDGYICPNTVNRKGHARHRIPYAKGNLDIFHCPDAKDAPYAKKIGKGNWPEIPAGKYYIDNTYMRNSSIGGWEPFTAWHGKARKFEGTKNPELYVMIFDGNLAQGSWEAIRYNAEVKRSRGAEYRHNETANVLFQDGHIAAYKAEDFKGGRGIGSPDAKGKKYIFASR
jgi:prepilin-type processing-associated H-X9-DG protein